MIFKAGDFLQFVLDDPEINDEIPYTFGYSKYNVDKGQIVQSLYLVNHDYDLIVERDAHRFNPILTECTETIEILERDGFRIERYKNRPQSKLIIMG